MGKALKLTLVLMGILLALFLIIPVFLPSQVEIKASKVIDLPKPVVFEQIENLQKRINWTPFNKTKEHRDSLSANTEGVGAKYYWLKGDTVTRILSVTKVKKPDFAEIELWFPNHHGATEKWTLSGDSTKTTVNWDFTVLNLGYPFGKWLGLIMSNSLQPILMSGLNKLETSAIKDNSEDKETKQ
ncbi:MAG: hypothetical protein JXR65_03145 [Bacteroidales bacterium]|nr:hypothetical protein [Bacteroidales bacterium]